MIIYLKQNTSSLPIALFSNKISPGFCINIAVNRGCYKYAKQLYTFCFNSSNTSSIIFSLIGNCFLLLFELKSDNNFYGFILLRKNYFWSRKRNLSFRIKKKIPFNLHYVNFEILYLSLMGVLCERSLHSSWLNLKCHTASWKLWACPVYRTLRVFAQPHGVPT